MWRSVATGLALAGLLAGCSWNGGGAGAATGSEHGLRPELGTVVGRVVLSGGPARPDPKEPRPATNTALWFVAKPSTGAPLVRNVRTDGEGRFSVILPPGRYRFGATFTATAPLARAPRKVMLVRAGRDVHVRLTESVR
jgi:hypothetical protein